MSDEGWLSSEAFSAACAALPLVSIDLFITRPGAGGPELLLGCRNNPPARGWWFTPGGRIRKNEPIASAMERVAREEVGMTREFLAGVELLGAWDHFYSENAFDQAVSTHYVNLAYLVPVPDPAALGSLPAGDGFQHSGWRWTPLDREVSDRTVHENVRAVVHKLVKRGLVSG